MAFLDVLSSRIVLWPRDYTRTVEFYRDQLGLAVAREYPGGTVFFAGQSLVEIAGHVPAPESGRFAGALWWQVRSLADTAAQLTRAGVSIDREPRTEAWGLREMWVRDPDEVPIVLVEIPPEHPLRRDTRW